MSGDFFLEDGEPLAIALNRARSAAADEVDAAYGRVLESVAADDGRLWAALAAEHVSVLRSAGMLTAAGALCGRYLAVAEPTARLPLLLERALVRSEGGAHADAAGDAAEIRSAGAELGSVDHARLRRVEGLAAAAAGERADADRFLNEARTVLLSVGDAAAAAVIDSDLRLVAARDGSDDAVSAILAEAQDSAGPLSVPRALSQAVALKSRHRYEEALQVVVTALASDQLDAALRLPLLEELVGLLVALRRGKALKALSAELPSAVVGAGGSAVGTEPPAVRFLRALLGAFRLMERGDVARARGELDAVRELAASERDRAYWHLASGESSIGAFKRRKVETDLTDAIADLTAASEYAEANQLLEARIRALRLQGEAFELLKRPDQASDRWARAHALEEELVALQVSDEVRATLLEDIPNEHDERVRVAAELAVSGPGGAAAATAVAGAIVAMESARGAAILSQVAPDAERSLRRLPAAGDGAAAWEWLRGVADATARDEAIWIMHARPDRVHHGIVGRGLVHHVDLPADRGELERLVKELRKQCNEFRLSQAAGRAQVSRLMEELGAAVGVGAVVGLVPSRVKRLVVVAGGVLSDIPLAALPIPAGGLGRDLGRSRGPGRSGGASVAGGAADVGNATDPTDATDPTGATDPTDPTSATGATVPIVARFAVSDLPCLSVRPLLRQRSARNRGGRGLLVSAFAATEYPVAASRRRKVLTEATPEAFEGELLRTPYQRVRILGHGQSDPKDASQTWLQFAGATPRDGRVQPGRFQQAALQACGTLILGACESGMARRVGRDERTGFVRAGLHAGSASVVAARWIAEVSVTAALLDRFEHHLRHLPRDVALQRAQLDVWQRRVSLSADVPDPTHPAWWACWTLYGDSGHQVRAPILRASARKPALLIRHLFRMP